MVSDKGSMSTIRFNHHDPVRAEVIAGDGTRRAVRGGFRSFTSRYLTLSTEEPIAASLAVSVEYNDMLFVGEVVSCRLESADCFRIEVRVEHTLSSLESLRRLNAALLGAQQIASGPRLQAEPAVAAHQTLRK